MMDKDRSYLLYFMFFGFFFCVHSVLQIKGDGAFFSHLLDTDSLFKILQERWGSWSSRMLIEAVLIPISRHVWLWRLCDSIMMTLLVYALNRIVFDVRSLQNILVTFVVVTIYPFSDMSTASFCATTLNYLWPLTCFFFCCIPIADIIRRNDYSKKLIPLYIAAAIFAANHEQVACGMFVISTIIVIAFIKGHRNFCYPLVMMSIALVELSLIMLCPGNSMRTQVAMPLCYETWNDISLFEKGYLAISSMASIVMNNYVIWFIFVAVSLFIIWKRKDKTDCIVGLFLVSIWLLVFAIRLFFIATHSKHILFSYETTSANPFSPSFTPIFLLSSGLYLVGSAIWFIARVWEDEKAIPLGILIAGIITRLMMGMSPTIFVSARRTMIFYYFALLLLILLMLRKHRESFPRKWLIIATILCLSYSLAKYGFMMYQVANGIGTLGIA